MARTGHGIPRPALLALVVATIAGGAAALTLSALTTPSVPAGRLVVFALLMVAAENSAVLLAKVAVSPALLVVMATVTAFPSGSRLLAAGLVGASGGLALDVLRQRALLVAALNGSQYTLAAVATAVIYGRFPATSPLVLALLAAAATFAVVNVALVWPVAALRPESTWAETWSEMAPTMPSYVAFGLGGSLIGTLYPRFGVLSVVGLLVPLFAVRSIFLAFQSQRRDYDRLELVYEFSRRTAASPGLAPSLDAVLSELRQLLHCEYAEVIAMSLDGDVVGGRSTVSGRSLSPAGRSPSGAELAGLADGPRLVSHPSDRTGWLMDRHFSSGMVAPLMRGDDVVGAIAVGDRQRDAAPFAVADLHTLETLANQLATVLERSSLVERLRYESMRDPLTALPNRRAFEGAIDDALARGDGLAILVVDLHDFKRINYTLGHAAGDLLLHEVGDRLSLLADGRVSLARLGGDEFGFLLAPAEGELDAVGLASTVQARLRPSFDVGEFRVEVPASIGIAIQSDTSLGPAALLHRAAVAMEAAKTRFDAWAIYQPEADTFDPRVLGLASQLRDALGRHELWVAYQPKIDLRSGGVLGAEALLRWRHPTEGDISPGEFIPVAEQTDLVHPLTAFVLKEAIAQSARWAVDGLDVPIAVNVSVRALVEGLAELVGGLLEENGVAPHRLTLELTETALMADVARCDLVIGQLARLGVSISVDDFGTGYSSLSHLRRLPLGELKIDQSFVAGVTTSDEDRAIVRSTIGLARSLNLAAVAEGVEDSATAQVLIDLGCESAQGFHWAAAMEATVFQAWCGDLATHR